MHSKWHMACPSILALMILLSMPIASLAQRAGQSVSIQYGRVAAAKPVDLKSGAVPVGAIGKAGQGSTSGMLYTVALGSGGEVQVVTDQREIRTGDCVAVEKAGDTANVRRVSGAYCDQANKTAVKAVEGATRQEAEECMMAKEQLVEAATVEAADLAARKIQLLFDN